MSATSKAIGVQFKIHVVGTVTGKTWSDTFRAKQTLTFRDKLAADRLRRELLGDGGGADTEAAAAALIVSQLSVRLTEAPEWWKNSGLDMEDPNLLRAVYDAAMKVEDDYMAEVTKEGETAKAALKKER